MSYYTPNMMKASAVTDTRVPTLGIQLDPKMQAAPAIPPMLRLHAGQGSSSALKISLTPSAAPARLSFYPSDAPAPERPVACAQDNLIRQIPRLRESLSALDEEIHSEMSKPDHAETMRIHSKILQLQDKRMNEVEGRLNTLARDGDEKSVLFEQLHHASGARIIAMSEELKDMHGEVDLHKELHQATGQRVLGIAKHVDVDASDAHARTVDRQLRDLTKAGEITRDMLLTCQERLEDASGASRKAQLAQDAHRQVQSELGDMRQDMGELTRKVEQAASGNLATRQLRSAGDAPAASAASASNEALLRQVAVSVIDIQKMLGASTQDVASLSRKVEKMETQLDTSVSHAATFSLLQRDMLSSNRPKKTRS